MQPHFRILCACYYTGDKVGFVKTDNTAVFGVVSGYNTLFD